MQDNIWPLILFAAAAIIIIGGLVIVASVLARLTGLYP